MSIDELDRLVEKRWTSRRGPSSTGLPSTTAWRTEEGAFAVLAGRSAADLPLSVGVLAGEQAPALRKPSGERSLVVL
ncbi:hypothetical protein ACFQVD_24165 [Streptosporangium amethystogenes subsp. fukuiense]|uniref:Uncharacterized protein n=1 Tax=Streptosporangium amethystogenes subsp. fukuiense TaxID=698418 RepID=A0ABW2T529_9ACTN